MIKARNRKLSMLLVLAMLMTMFVGVGTASAAAIEFDSINAPSYSTSTSPQSDDAQVLITVDDAIVFGTKENIVTVRLPSGTEFKSGTNGSTVVLEVVGTDQTVFKDIYDGPNPNVYATIKSSSAADLYVDTSTIGPVSGEVKFLLTFDGLVVKSGSGDLNVTLLAPSGSAFKSGTVTIATIAGKGSVQVLAGDKVTFGDQGGYIDGITIAEGSAGTLKVGDEITLKLPKGFTWGPTNNLVIGGGWGFDGLNGQGSSGYFSVSRDDNNRELILRINSLTGASGSAGRITIGTDGFTGAAESAALYPLIIVDDNAKLGDIEVSVSSTNKNGPDADIVVASYGDYDIKVEEGTSEEVIAGRTDQELGEFYIEEGIAGSLIANRTIYLELPKGVKWVEYPSIDAEDGDLILSDNNWSLVSNSSSRKIKITVDKFSDDASKLVFEDMKVKIAPSFEGPLDITVSGNAGVEGTVTVAEVIKPITVKSENPTKVEIGAMNQPVGDILIIENIEEGILDGEYNQIVISLPRGIYFSSEPTVEVESGDLEIDDVDLDDSDFNKDGALVITIDYASSTKSTIRVSDVFLTVDRTVPEGTVLAKFEGAVIEEDDDDDWYFDGGSTAFVDWDTDESLGSVEIATTITPSEGGHAKFVVGSNIYEIGGIPYVMDAVPYIKNDRSYVPMRYLANMVAAEITWEQSDQTITLINNETTVVFTVGSTSYTVNGEVLNADVAPEIVNDRAFLPARFAAEAFGAEVGWEAATQTVIIIR